MNKGIFGRDLKWVFLYAMLMDVYITFNRNTLGIAKQGKAKLSIAKLGIAKLGIAKLSIVKVFVR